MVLQLTAGGDTDSQLVWVQQNKTHNSAGTLHTDISTPV